MNPKSKLKSIFVPAALGLALSLPASGQQDTPKAPSSPQTATSSNAAALPSVEHILDAYVKAIGGREAWKKLSSRVSTGTIEVPAMDLSGMAEFDEKAPNMVLAKFVINGAAFEQGFDGTTGWTNDPKDGLREQSGAELAETKRDADFYHPLDLNKLYSKFAVTGIEKINDRDTYVVEATAADGEVDKLYFDTRTGFVERIVSHHHTVDGATVITEDFEDYREIDGIRLPFTVHQSSSESAFTIKFTEVRHNVPLENSQFSKPAVQ